MDVNQYGGKEIEAKYYKYKAKYLRSKFGAGALMHGGAGETEQLTADKLTQILKKTPQNTEPITLQPNHKYVLFIDLARYFSTISLNEGVVDGNKKLSIAGKPPTLVEISKIVDYVFKFRQERFITSDYINESHKYDFIYDLNENQPPSDNAIPAVPTTRVLRLIGADKPADIRTSLFTFMPSYFKNILTDDMNNKLIVFEKGGILTDPQSVPLLPLNNLTSMKLITEADKTANKDKLKAAMDFINDNKLGRVDCAVIFELDDVSLSKVRQCYLSSKSDLTCEFQFSDEADLISFIDETKRKVNVIESPPITTPTPSTEQPEITISSGGRKTNYLFF
jgi:hypothetical protein